MQVDILDILRSDTRLLERQTDGPRGLIRRIAHAHAMKRLASRSIAGDLGVDVSAAFLSVVIVFQHKHPGAFCHYKAITIRREWTRRALRLVVPRLRQSAKQRVSPNDSRRDRRIYAAHQKHRNDPSLNVLVSVANSVSR